MWCFTIHGEREALEELFLTIACPRWGRYGKCQLEQCPETGRFHLQGFLVLPRTQRLSFVRQIHSTAHWEIAKGSLEQNEAYCGKEESRVVGTVPKVWGERPKNQGHRTDLESATAVLKDAQGTVRQRMKRLAEEFPTAVVKHHKGFEYLARLTEHTPAVDAPAQWREWQSALLAYLESEEAIADDRTIVWVTDPAGGMGKSTLVRYLVANAGATMLNGKIADMAHAYAGEGICLFDVTRTQLEHMDHLYSFAEALKNGVIFSPKYESGMKVFKPPRVVFFANTTFSPGKWTPDRVHEIVISQNNNVNNFAAATVINPIDYTAGGNVPDVVAEAALLQAAAGGFDEGEIIEID